MFAHRHYSEYRDADDKPVEKPMDKPMDKPVEKPQNVQDKIPDNSDATDDADQEISFLHMFDVGVDNEFNAIPESTVEYFDHRRERCTEAVQKSGDKLHDLGYRMQPSH